MEKRKRNKMGPGRRMVVTMLVVSLIVGLGSIGYRYLQDYYPATISAELAMLGSDGIVIEEEEGYYRFLAGGEATGRGIIFYPGGKVEETAYAPLLCSLAASGFDIYLMRMPFRLAILKRDAADEVIGDVEQEWILMGHSLGGSMAVSYAADHLDQVDGLVLLGAYSTSDLSDTGLKVLSIYGDKDQVLSRERYEKNRERLPDGTVEHVIDGGNHSGYGYYGTQDGDGEAAITPEEQQEEVVDLVTTVFAE